MTIAQQEFEAILADPTKRIDGDIEWRDDDDHSPAQEFRARVLSEPGWPLTVIGWWQPQSRKLTYLLRHDAAGRIHGINFGNVVHHNPTCQNLDGTHEHRWTAEHRDKAAQVPADITAQWDQPELAWAQFCAKAVITHGGTLYPPASQEEMPL